MRTYSVVAVLPGRYRDYQAFHIRGETINENREPIDFAKLALTVTVAARNKADANAKVRKQYPDHTIDEAATDLLG